MPHAPSESQYLAALETANATRFAIAELRQRLRALPEAEARRLLIEVLNNPTEQQAAAPVERLLLAVKRWGHQKTQQTLRRANIYAAGKRVRDLTPRQRGVICDVLRDPRLILPTTTTPRLEDAA